MQDGANLLQVVDKCDDNLGELADGLRLGQLLHVVRQVARNGARPFDPMKRGLGHCLGVSRVAVPQTIRQHRGHVHGREHALEVAELVVLDGPGVQSHKSQSMVWERTETQKGKTRSTN